MGEADMSKPQKFHPGDKIKIIGYSNPTYMHKEEWKNIAKFNAEWKQKEYKLFFGEDIIVTPKEIPDNIIRETDTMYVLDWHPEQMNQVDVIEGSYRDLYPMMSNREEDKHSYSLKKFGAWFNEDCMELVSKYKGKMKAIPSPANELAKIEFDKLK